MTWSLLEPPRPGSRCAWAPPWPDSIFLKFHRDQASSLPFSPLISSRSPSLSLNINRTQACHLTISLSRKNWKLRAATTIFLSPTSKLSRHAHRVKSLTVNFYPYTHAYLHQYFLLPCFVCLFFWLNNFLFYISVQFFSRRQILES
jgi:hypothetical protein